jgi:hypothetical protein
MSAISAAPVTRVADAADPGHWSLEAPSPNRPAEPAHQPVACSKLKWVHSSERYSVRSERSSDTDLHPRNEGI